MEIYNDFQKRFESKLESFLGANGVSPEAFIAECQKYQESRDAGEKNFLGNRAANKHITAQSFLEAQNLLRSSLISIRDIPYGSTSWKYCRTLQRRHPCEGAGQDSERYRSSDMSA